jgi:hypothetical protein
MGKHRNTTRKEEADTMGCSLYTLRFNNCKSSFYRQRKPRLASNIYEQNEKPPQM